MYVDEHADGNYRLIIQIEYVCGRTCRTTKLQTDGNKHGFKTRKYLLQESMIDKS